MESTENRLSAGSQGKGNIQPSATAGSKGRSRWVLRLTLVGIAVAWLALVATSWAQAAESGDEGDAGQPVVNAPNSKDDDNYNFNWLDPDKKIYVLQNRKFRKANQLMLSLLGGIGLSNSYRNSLNIEPRIAYYFSETWGIEGFYTGTSNKANNTYEALVGTNTTTLPVVREVKSQIGGLLHFSPWYAKLNVFNQILYFDWYFSAGFGSVNTSLDTRTKASDAPKLVDQNFTAFYFGTGHHYYLSQRFSLRLDVTGGYFSAPYKGATGEKAWFPNYNLGIGVACRI